MRNPRKSSGDRVLQNAFADHEMIPLVDAIRWREALAGIPHDFSHTWEYNRALQLTSGLPTFLYQFRGANLRVVCPLSERLEGPYADVITPPGFGGFIGVGDWKNFPQIWAAYARHRGWVCGYIGLNPILSPVAEFDAVELHTTNNVYVIDLTLDAHVLLERMDQSRRRELRRRQARDPCLLITDRESLTKFVLAEYPAFMKRVNASSSYRRTSETLAAICALDKVLLIGAQGALGIEAAYLFAHTSHVATYLFSVVLPETRNHIAPMIWHGVQWLQQLGVRYLNLGGGIRPDDTLAHSKQRFGAQCLPLHALKQVYDPTTYAALCSRRGCDPTPGAGYFPAYRDTGTWC